MPIYYLSSLAGNYSAKDWDFTRYIPHAVIINLGTNDWNHNSGKAWVKKFEKTYIKFIQNITNKYNNKKLPIFVA